MTYEAMWVRLNQVSDRQSNTELIVAELRFRVGAMEKRHEPKPENEILAVFKEALTPKVWALVIFLIIASLLGIISPKEIVSGIVPQSAEHGHRLSVE